MPITNIIDRRKRHYRFQKINAIVEAAWHDNACKDADQIMFSPDVDDGPDYKQKEHVTLSEAVAWASSFKQAVTLYLYDKNGGIYEIAGSEEPNEQYWDEVAGAPY